MDGKTRSDGVSYLEVNMPQLRIFAPCQQILVNVTDQSASLIGLMDTLKVSVPAGQDIAADTSIPIRWHTFTLWHMQEADVGKSFEQRTILFLPNGEEAVSITQTFQMATRAHRVVGVIDGFPVGHEGQYVVKLLLREEGSDADWREIDEYPVLVAHGEIEVAGSELEVDDGVEAAP